MPRIGNQFPFRREAEAELLKNLPIPLPGSQDYGLWPAPERVAKSQSRGYWCRLLENLRIRHDPHKSAEHGFRKTKSGWSLYQLFDEHGIRLMFARVFPVCIDQDIDIAEPHGERSP